MTDELHEVRFLVGSGDPEELAQRLEAEERQAAAAERDDERDAEAPADEDTE
jgi:hypothetical protein